MFDEMITHCYRLDGVNDAFDALRGGHVMRYILTFD